MRPNPSSAIEQQEPRRLFAVAANDPLFPLQSWYPQVSLPQAWDITTGSSNVLGHEGTGTGGGIYIGNASVGLDAITVTNVRRNTATTSAQDIFGSYWKLV